MVKRKTVPVATHRYICASRDPSPRFAETDDSVVFEGQPEGLTRTSRDLRILKVGPKESPSGSGYTTQVRRCAMPNAVREASAVTAAVFATRFQPDPPGAIIAEEPECAWSAPEQPAGDSEPRCH